jgi:hypothetical protein
MALQDVRRRVCRRRETLDDLLAGDVALATAGGSRQEEGP